jgi:hypothetical protein
MIWTRREFLVATGLVALAEPPVAAAPAAPTPDVLPIDSPTCLVGDPYLATVPDPGLGGDSFGALRDYALRFGSAATDRDRHVLGVDLDHA